MDGTNSFSFRLFSENRLSCRNFFVYFPYFVLMAVNSKNLFRPESHFPIFAEKFGSDLQNSSSRRNPPAGDPRPRHALSQCEFSGIRQDGCPRPRHALTGQTFPGNAAADAARTQRPPLTHTPGRPPSQTHRNSSAPAILSSAGNGKEKYAGNTPGPTKAAAVQPPHFHKRG